MTTTVATEPNGLGRYFIERSNSGDVGGLLALYEPNAVLAFPPGSLAIGHAEIRKVYEHFVAAAPVLVAGSAASSAGERRPGTESVHADHR